MRTAFRKLLVDWQKAMQNEETRNVHIYPNPIKEKEFSIILCQSSKITFRGKSKEIDCRETFYTLGQNDSSVNSNGDINRLETAIKNLSAEYDRKMANAISEIVEEAGISPQNLDDFI